MKKLRENLNSMQIKKAAGKNNEPAGKLGDHNI
jgi:hypothetical protein